MHTSRRIYEYLHVVQNLSKATPVQAWTDPEGSRQLAYEGGKIVSPMQ